VGISLSFSFTTGLVLIPAALRAGACPTPCARVAAGLDPFRIRSRLRARPVALPLVPHGGARVRL